MIYSAAIEPYGGSQSLIIRRDSGILRLTEQNLVGFNSRCYVTESRDEIQVYDEDGNLKHRRTVTGPVQVTDAGIIIRERYGNPYIMDPFTGKIIVELR